MRNQFKKIQATGHRNIWNGFTEKPLSHPLRMLNINGHMHGGMIASVCDMTMGILAHYVKGTNNCVTVSLNIEYMRGISAEEDIIVEATVEKAGRNIIFLSAKVYRVSDGKMAARASATFM